MIGRPLDTKPQYVNVNVGLLVFVISRARIEVGGPPHQRGVVGVRKGRVREGKPGGGGALTLPFALVGGVWRIMCLNQ